MAAGKKPLDIGILLGVGKPKRGEEHEEPDEDNEGGPSDEDADNLPMGALEAYQEHCEAEKAGDDAAACAALGRMFKAFMAEPEREEMG